MNSTINLYQDLEDIEATVEIVKLREKIEELQTNNEKLTIVNSDLRNQIEKLLADRTNLEHNIMAVYNTALREIDRKNRDIDDLKVQFKNKKTIN
jgi:predicted RNase H-like nuclease (RuvC/YqgF family)